MAKKCTHPSYLVVDGVLQCSVCGEPSPRAKIVDNEVVPISGNSDDAAKAKAAKAEAKAGEKPENKIAVQPEDKVAAPPAEKIYPAETKRQKKTA